MGNAFRRFVERLIPWYDPEVERKRDEHTESIRRRSISLRITVEQMTHDHIRSAYSVAGRKVYRR